MPSNWHDGLTRLITEHPWLASELIPEDAGVKVRPGTPIRGTRNTA